MDFASVITPLVEKALKAGAAPGPSTYWVMKDLIGPAPGAGSGRAQLMFVFWTAATTAGPRLFWSVQTLVPAAAVPSQAEITTITATAVSHLAAQLAGA